MLLLNRRTLISIAIFILIGSCVINSAHAEADGYYCSKLMSSVNQNISGASVSSCQEFKVEDGTNRKEIIAHLIFPKEQRNIDNTKWNQPTDECAFTTWNPSEYQSWWRKLPSTFWSDFEQSNEIESSECNRSINSLFPLPSCLYYQDFSKVSYKSNISPTIFEITSYSNFRCPLSADYSRSEMVRFYTRKSSQIVPPMDVQPPKKDCKEAEEEFLVKNSGISSNNSRDLLKRLQTSVIDEAPKVVLLMVGTNDILNPKKTISIANYKANVIQIIDKVQECSKIVLATIPPVDAKKRKKSKENPNKKISVLNKVIKNISIQKNIPLIEVNRVFNQIKPLSKVLGNDGLHPNADGYNLISKIAYDVLKNRKLPKNGIICFGDSITKGVDGKNHQLPSYPSKLIEKLVSGIPFI